MSITERVRKLIVQSEKEERARQEQIQAEAEKQLPMAHHLDVSKKLMAAIRAEEMLRDINKDFLQGRGKIEKAEGIFTHEELGEYAVDARTRGRYEYDCSHPISWVQLSWPGHTLSVFVGVDSSDKIQCIVGRGIATDRIKKNEVEDTVASEFHNLNNASSLARISNTKLYDAYQEYDSLAEQVEAGLAELFVRQTTFK